MKEFYSKKILSIGWLTSSLWIILGNIIYAFSINVIIVPIGLYNGGFMGIAQLIKTFMNFIPWFNVPSTVDVTGIIYFILNAPLFIYAYKVIGKGFMYRSLVSIALSSICLTFMPILKTPIFEDYLSACVVGGIIGGIGSGMVLRGGGSGGGQDVIGVCLSKTHPNVSVGNISIATNIFIYGVCLFLFNIQIAIYSFIYSSIRSVAIDKLHTQNINIRAIIITKYRNIDKDIANELHRGVTFWHGTGAYTGDHVNVIITAITKYEVDHLKYVVQKIDPKAFIILSENEHIVGNFKKFLN